MSSNDVTRRDFLKGMGMATAALFMPSAFFQACKKEVQQAAAVKPVIWIQGQSCSGCSISLLNNVDPGIPSLITEHISLNFHQTLSAATGDGLIAILDEAVAKDRKDFILVVEGAIPVADDHYCTMGEKQGEHLSYRHWLETLAPRAEAIVAVGACATFGGIPSGAGNRTGARGTLAHLKKKGIEKPLINIPGCPPHPDWMAGTLLHYLMHGVPELDSENRPVAYFGKTVHEQCELLEAYEAGHFAQKWGEEGCLYQLGCLGIDTYCDLPSRKWLGMNSCTGSGSGCISCTEPVFPDVGGRGLYMHRFASAQNKDSGKRG